MRVYVINCRRQKERRASARSKLDKAGVPFEFFDGLSADDALGRHLFEAIDDREFLLNTGRHVTPGEIGCFASHRELWKRAAELDEPVVIMEDDFELLGDFNRALEAASSLIDRAGFIRLQTDLRAKKCSGSGVGEFRLCRFTKPPHGLMAYAVSADVARRFVARTRVLDAPVDIFTKKYWEHGRPLYVLRPYAVGPSTYHGVTTIQGRRKTAKPPAIAVRRFLRKAGWYARRWYFNWQHRDDIYAITRRFAEIEPGGGVRAVS